MTIRLQWLTFTAVIALLFTLVDSQSALCADQFMQSCSEVNTTAGFSKCCSWISNEYSTDKTCLCDILALGNVNNSQALQLLNACDVDTTGVGNVCSVASPLTPPPPTTLTAPPPDPDTPPAPDAPVPPPPPPTTLTPPPPDPDTPPAPDVDDYQSTYPEDTPISPTPSSDSENDDNSPVLSIAAISGIAVGGAFLLIVAGGLLLFLILRRKRGKKTSQPSPFVDPNLNIRQPLPQVGPYVHQPQYPQVYQNQNVQQPPPQFPVPPHAFQPRPDQPKVNFLPRGVPVEEKGDLYQPRNIEMSLQPQFESPRGNPVLEDNNTVTPSCYKQPPVILKAGQTSKSTITYEELSNATNGFSEENLVGEGRLGPVYVGRLDDERDVAIKKLNKDIWKGKSDKQMQKEIETISRINHKNLVSLVGYCTTSEEKLLVYEFVPNNTLTFHLHEEEEEEPTLDWATRMKIALGSARGLAHLHEGCRQTFVHGDIKSSNILLDFDFEPQIANFGVDKLLSGNKNHRVIKGTFGYMSPEYAASGKLTVQSDVYSFGVIIVELITGLQPASESGPFADRSLVDWATPVMTHAMVMDDFSKLVDGELEGMYDHQQMKSMVACALACLRRATELRPRMTEVLRTLEGEISMDKLNHGVEPGKSIMFRPSDQSDVENMRNKVGRKKSRANKEINQ